MISVKKMFFIMIGIPIFVYTRSICCIPVIPTIPTVHEQSFHNAVGNVFIHAQETLAAGNAIITSGWLSCKELEEVKNVLSDMIIEVNFDKDAEKFFTTKFQEHLSHKIRDEIEKAGERENVCSEDIRQLLYLSETLCDLSKGTDCHRMIHAIKDENFALRHNIKTNKKVRKHIRKEEMRQLCEIVALGAQPRR